MEVAQLGFRELGWWLHPPQHHFSKVINVCNRSAYVATAPPRMPGFAASWTGCVRAKSKSYGDFGVSELLGFQVPRQFECVFSDRWNFLVHVRSWCVSFLTASIHIAASRANVFFLTVCMCLVPVPGRENGSGSILTGVPFIGGMTLERTCYLQHEFNCLFWQGPALSLWSWWGCEANKLTVLIDLF